MDEFQKIGRRIESYRNEMIDMQIKLCSLPAMSPVNGGEGESQKAEVLHQFLKKIGFQKIDVIKASDLDVPPGYRPNLLAILKGKNPSKTIWIMTHMDVVPPGELELWKGNPFKAWIEEGKIYGRGVEDNQQDMVASLYAVKALSDEGIQPPYNVGIVLVSDEETGSQKGIEYLLQTSNPFHKNDLLIVPDSGNPEGTQIEVAEKSVLWLKFKTIGKQTHGSTPKMGINSFKAASHLVTQLDQLYHYFEKKDPLFTPPFSTFEPTKKDNNVPNINTIPGEDIFYMDNRILPLYSLEDVKKKIQEITQLTEKKFQVRITVEEVRSSSAAPQTPSNAPVIQILKKAIKEVYGKEAQPTGIGGGTAAAFFRKAGYNAVCWAKLEKTAHQPNEYCVIDNLVGDAKVFAHIFLQDSL